MTTLPQTTPIRLPRPNTGTQLSVPSATAHSVVPAPASSQMTGGDVWRVVRSNLWLIVLCVLVAGVSGYFINGYLAKNHSRYTAVGFIQILPTQPADPLRGILQSSIDNQSLPIELGTQAQYLRSDNLINEILNSADSPIRQTTWWTVGCNSDPQKARASLNENLTVVPRLDTKLIQVQMTYSIPEDAAVIVQAIGDQHVLDQRKVSTDQNADERKMLQELRTKYQAVLRSASEDVQQKASELNISGIGTSGFISTKQMEIEDKIRLQLTAQAEKGAADAAYASFMADLQGGQDPPKITQLVEQDPTVQQYKVDADRNEVELSDLSNGTLGSSNPLVISLQKRQELYQRKLDDARAARATELRNTMKTELVANKEGASRQLSAINAQVDQDRKEMAELSNKMASYLTRRDEEISTRDQLKNVDHRLDEIAQVATASNFGTVDWFVRPTKPDAPSFPKMTTTMGTALALGLGLSLSIAFLREITDTTVRSPRDIQRVGQMNLLGMVPHEADDPQSAGARLPLVIFEAPHSIMAEQLRQVRTRLQHAASLDTTRSILVTSPTPGDGKSTIACNLAAGLALNGRRILLVDSNFRRPDLHRIFGVGNEVGFSSVLNDINAFDSSVRESSVPNLSVMSSGPKPTNPTELLESQLLLDFIERALEEYDHVVFDSGPMLFVSESVALAPRVDGVITVVRARTNTRGVLQRMRDGLRSVKAEHLGVVLNGVRSQAGGYYGRSIKTYYEYQNAD